jgi:hypothetical protein
MLTEYFVAADLESPGVYNATYSNPTDWFIEALGGARSDAGIRIDADGAMKYAPWWQGISIIAGDVARLPLMPINAPATMTENDSGNLRRGDASTRLPTPS